MRILPQIKYYPFSSIRREKVFFYSQVKPGIEGIRINI
jgi:hypothetical protein